MKKKITIFGVVGLLSCFLAIMMIVAFGSGKVSRADGPTKPVSYEVAGESEFYIESGASIRIDNKTGIKFTAKVTKGFHDAITSNGKTVKYIAFIVNSGNTTKYLGKEFNTLPKFEANADDTAEFEYVISSIYDAVESENIGDTDKLEVIYGTEFFAEVYAQIDDGGNITYIKAYPAADKDRSIRSVANAAYYEQGGDYYKSESLDKYFSGANRNEDVNGYVVKEGGSAILTMPETNYSSGDTVNVMFGGNAKKYSATVNANKQLVIDGGVNPGNVDGGDTEYVTVIDSSGIFSTKVLVYDAAVTASNISSKLHSATDEYLILTEDIDMSELGTWASYGATDYNDSSNWFTGVFDGNGHTISNFTTNGSNFNGGLFCCIAGGTVKNLVIKDSTITNSNGIIASRTRQNYTANIENVFITVKACGTTNCGAITSAGDATLNVKDVFVSMPYNAGASVNVLSGVYRRTINIDGLYYVGGNTVYNASGASGEKVTGNANVYTGFDKFEAAMTAEDITVTPLIADAFESLKIHVRTEEELNEVIRSANSKNKYILLDSNIKMKNEWTAYGLSDYNNIANIFIGTFDGQGHTITGFTMNGTNFNGGLFQVVNDGTFKNVIFKDAKITQNDGLLASRFSSGYAYVENVYITVKSILTNASPIFGLNNGTFNISNSYIEFKSGVSVPSTSYFLHGSQYSGTLNVNNDVYLVGSASVSAAGANVIGTPFTCDSSDNGYIEVYKRIIAENSAISSEIKSYVKANSNVVEINHDNINTVLRALRSEPAILTEDINMSDITWTNYSDYTTSIYTGIFDGNGHVISDFKTGSTAFYGGLFSNLKGATIRNVIIKNANVRGQNGVFAGRGGEDSSATYKKPVTFENVFVSVAASNRTNSCALISASYEMILDNVYVQMAGSGTRYLTSTYSYKLTMTNVYLVGSLSAIHNEDNVNYVTGTATIYSDGATFYGNRTTNGANEFLINAYKKVNNIA